ncbi:hypothetical protein BDW59DRAFT_165036 [Aspergillus cavernicola]|uniref:Protein kinase domain-containing protein n=1 Tax=Aspergillus cavernicola TaxID=176166 RepID=A0ABR4HW11_9EURO
MEPASLAFSVVAVFKDAYLTAKFVRATAKSIRNYRGEQEDVVVHLSVQICRLKNLSRLFRGADDNKVDMDFLETVPDKYLHIIRNILTKLQSVLANYTKLAAALDEDYQKYSPLSPTFQFDPTGVLCIDDNDDGVGSATRNWLEDTEHSESRRNSSETKAKRWSFFGFGSKPTKPKVALLKTSKSMGKLSPGVKWLFTRGELEKILREFEEWNKDLEYMIGPLLAGFGFFENRALQGRLQADGNLKLNFEINLFQGHLALNSASVESKDLECTTDNLISWEDAKSRIKQPRIVAEYKQNVFPVLSRADSETSGRGTPINGLYGSQLARLLHTSGEHDFRTLPLNAYARDKERFQYIFLFDYPKGAADRPPVSLYDLIASSRREPQFKLELKQRFRVAQTVAQAIGAFHSDSWLHKSIRAHAIKFFFFQRDGESSCDFNNLYLTDFGFARPVAGSTSMLAAARDIDHDIYQHPDRWDPPRASFSQIHDIYSLGVVLLEIGLWQTARQLYEDIVQYELRGKVPAEGVSAKKINRTFLDDAKQRLAHRMGAPYRDAVLACLDGDWGDLVGTRDFASKFQERVVGKVDIKAFLT